MSMWKDLQKDSSKCQFEVGNEHGRDFEVSEMSILSGIQK